MDRIRSFLQTNLMLKVAALLLAIIIWSMVHDAISNPSGLASLPEEVRVLKGVPVLVLGRASSAGEIELKPSSVTVTVKGPPEQVRRLTPTQITLYVDASNIGNKDRYRQRILSSINASGVQIGSISPPTVEMEIR